MNNALLSFEFPELVKAVQKLGLNTIEARPVDKLPEFEARHADMQCIKINDTVFVLKNSVYLYERLVGLGYNVIQTQSEALPEYPGNILLNALFFNGKLYCKKDSLRMILR